MQNPFHYFNKIYCINIDARTDRWQQCEQEFKKHDIEVERFSAITNGATPFISFNKSQAAVISKALSDGCENALILEDDIEFRNTMHLHYAMNELPEDWECLYLGGNIIGIDIIQFQQPVRHSSHLFKLIDCWQTHAVAYSKGAMQWVLERFDVNNGYNYDEWLRHNVLPRGKSYIIAPQIALQRKSYSDIWKTETNFEHLFEQGNKLLV